jgi:signal peptidase I
MAHIGLIRFDSLGSAELLALSEVRLSTSKFASFGLIHSMHNAEALFGSSRSAHCMEAGASNSLGSAELLALSELQLPTSKLASFGLIRSDSLGSAEFLTLSELRLPTSKFASFGLIRSDSLGSAELLTLSDLRLPTSKFARFTLIHSMHDAEALLGSSRMHSAEAHSHARMHGARAHGQARSAYRIEAGASTADCTERTARRRTLKYCGALTAWRQEPQPGASTAISMEAGASIWSLKFGMIHPAPSPHPTALPNTRRIGLIHSDSVGFTLARSPRFSPPMKAATALREISLSLAALSGWIPGSASLGAAEPAMFSFLLPKHVKFGRQFVKDARKLLAYKRDLWSEETVASFEAKIAALERATESKDRAAIGETATALDAECAKYMPPSPDAAWRENCEVFLVAIVIALAVRTYFLQPFTIPTGSMQPTLNGIRWNPSTEPSPGFLTRVFEAIWHGRSYLDVVAKRDVVILEMREFKSLLPFVDRTPFIENFGFFQRTELITDHGNYVIQESAESVNRPNFLPQFGVTIPAGTPIARGYFDTGDHVFVDKCTYNFFKPERGDVFFFNTQTLPTGENRQHEDGPSQFYIKRLAGLPGDTLRVDPPKLYTNGKLAEGRGFGRVMSAANGYEGYVNGFSNFTRMILRSPDDPFTVPPKHYFAMGDNSNHSSDSRDWGPVPQENIMGRAVFVYWPFAPHWGLIGR